MKKSFLLLGLIVFCGWWLGVGLAQADDALVSATPGWKEELASDRKLIKEEVLESKASAKVAKTEEQQLQQQIQEALVAGDKAKANQLKEQLRLMHRENVQERIQDRKEIQETKKAYKADIKEARKEGYLPPKGRVGVTPDRRGNR